MKHLRLVLILAFAAAFASACGGGSEGARSVPDDAVAVVGDGTVTKAQFDKVLAQVKRSYAARKQPFPKAGTEQYATLQGQVVQFLVERSEYDQKAEELGVEVSDKEVDDRLNQLKQQVFASPTGKPLTKAQVEKRYRQQLKAQGLTDRDVRDGIRAQLLRDKIFKKITEDIKVSDDDAKKYYDDHKKQYEQPAVPESRDVRHILVKSRAKALDVYRRLKRGGDFAKLALKFSIDPSKTSGGRLTVCKKQSVSCLKTVAPFEQTAFALKPNAISKPVHTRFGWHVIQALGPVKPPRKATPTPFDQVKEQIKQTLVEQKKQEAINKWWEDTKKDFSKKIAYQTGYKPPSTTTTQTTTTG